MTIADDRHSAIKVKLIDFIASEMQKEGLDINSVFEISDVIKGPLFENKYEIRQPTMIPPANY